VGLPEAGLTAGFFIEGVPAFGRTHPSVRTRNLAKAFPIGIDWGRDGNLYDFDFKTGVIHLPKEMSSEHA
jgi:hypothetical protein